MTAKSPRKPAGKRRRVRSRGWLGLGDRLSVRIAARSLAVAFLGTTIGYGLVIGNHLGDNGAVPRHLMARLAGEFGYAAQTVRISGLSHHTREAVLQAIDVEPGGSLIGFDPLNARRLLENLDWVKSATVQLIYPNQLQVNLTERVPFAIWQRDGLYYVIDATGSAISSLNPLNFSKLLLVTGEGAQMSAKDLVNHLEARPQLLSRVKAAARVGNRRWNLYLANGTKVLLPEENTDRALARLVDAERRYGLDAKDVGRIDLRIDGQITLAPITPVSPEIKVSRR